MIAQLCAAKECGGLAAKKESHGASGTGGAVYSVTLALRRLD
jgi:hypothetical protein